MTLARANSYLEIVRSLGMLAGPVAGGILIGWIGASNALMVDATSFAVLCCIVAMSGLRRPQKEEAAELICSPTTAHYSVIEELWWSRAR
ncbi:hypothetical protein GCM10020258_50760 [Sphingomonas yabuuchiae]